MAKYLENTVKKSFTQFYTIMIIEPKCFSIVRAPEGKKGRILELAKLGGKVTKFKKS